jgi:predicted transcriptional regulator
MSRLTQGELRVMQLLWEHGEMKPGDIQDRFPEPIKNPALRSYLAILVDKGHVVRRKVGKAYLYKAKTPQQRAFAAMLGDLVQTFCSGSVQELVMALVRKEKLSANDLLELKRLADAPPTSANDQVTSGDKRRSQRGEER